MRFKDSQGTEADNTMALGSECDGYDSLNELLQHIGDKLNSYTSLINREYGCYLYMINDKYYYGKIIKGEHDGVSFDKIISHPKNAQILGTIHSHPNCYIHICDRFSEKDFFMANTAGYTIYLASPTGELYKYTPGLDKYNTQMRVDGIDLIKDNTPIDCRRLRDGSKQIKPFICFH